MVTLPISDELSISDFYYNPLEGILIVTVQNSTVLSKLGRVWSIIEPEILGFIRIFKGELVPGKLLPKFKSLFMKEYESKIISLEYLEKAQKVLYGFHDGQISYFDFSEGNMFSKPQPKSFIFSTECILFIKHLYEKKCLVILPTAIKIVQGNLISDKVFQNN